MRSSKSRSRGKNRNRFSANGGNITNRVFDSSGPEGKVRGTPQQIIDKYNQLVRDAQLSNDRVAAENFAQHAEHYTRLLAENQREIEARRESQEAQNRDRQAQRDSERAERLERQENHQASDKTEQPNNKHAQHESSQPYIDNDLGSAPQPDLLDTSESNLVETPETKPRKPSRKPRKPKAELSGDAPVGEAEPKPKRAPRRRKEAPTTDTVVENTPQPETSGE
ncbi:DUF4167 domain-containing protein [Falsihalocynthiibacter sp. SS001]|uniref:DUF4167 domain-containing protein n=1 Tax=Falsihalocynthiibacter sp. SS001 TaxID=3349698 RepID=UPI0036D41167